MIWPVTFGVRCPLPEGHMLKVILTLLSFLLIHTAEAKPVTVTVQSVNVAPYDTANQILSGKAVADLPAVEAEKAVVTINRTVAGKLGISIDENHLKNIKAID
jgi:hypothetical protein